ncbi:alpha-galactosidase [Lederbergia wuyishanensis]|uniref:Alpha-galactosidase n=1 Tax=Lederbergia wuyishanensis TaxID=1347903 RepID=A0ABU0D8X5_9BACI|nr:alpha-galactosidase [Lederbergia wuyishanensis]MCJ8007551.1 alpha-galactosidase [Lederbergia wuyishanensis]MDQ0344868.1 alpha-galactosidase [Lederbergia wuyishanensis]
MTIHYEDQSNIFHLQAKDMSYIIQIVNGTPAHAYWGKKLRHEKSLEQFIAPRWDDKHNSLPLDGLPQEYPQYGTGDFRSPAYQVHLSDGSRITELVYKKHRVIKGKPKLEGLPAVYVENENEAETLELELRDEYSGLTVFLSYTVFADHNAIARSVKFLNEGEDPIELWRALSASIDFHDSDYEMMYLSGAWAREAQVRTRPLLPGSTSINSKRGVSSHQHNPFVVIKRPDANEDHGDVYGFSLVYSGSFLAEAEVDQYFNTRISIGINPFDFGWTLNPGDHFQTPETVMVYSSEGIGGMSRTYHKLYRTRLARGNFRDKERPILVNNWEATYFNFDADKIVSIAEAGAELGIELFVLDDGWFGKRDDDTTSLGDWYEDRRKLPNGLEDLAERVKATGLQFGLWVEPEMVSPESELYKKHPDWCIHVKDRRRTLQRNQLVLDFSRKEVRDYIFEVLSDIFTRVPISYIKWDMNRYLTEIGSVDWPTSQQTEIGHRYVLGLYELLERITTKFPHILFESCSSGGGRFDPGMLFYMPQTWTSDTTDAIERLRIQYGTSIIYPNSSMGAHISSIPNHQVGRMTPLTTRGDVAMSGNFGYEMDLRTFSNEEKEIAKQQVSLYKEIRPLVQKGDFYRLKNPFIGNEAAWMFVSEDQREALVFYFKVLAEPQMLNKRLVLKGLNPEFNYVSVNDGIVYGGDQLLNAGIYLPKLHGDYASTWFKLRAQ